MGDKAWIIPVKQETTETRLVNLSKEDFPTRESANKYIAEALQNIDFTQLNKFPTSEYDSSVEIDGEDESFWVEEEE